MSIKETVKEYIQSEIIPYDSVDISDETKLISGGYIDSVTTLQLVDFLEKTFDIEFEAHEVDRDYLDTLISIEAFIREKKQ